VIDDNFFHFGVNNPINYSMRGMTVEVSQFDYSLSSDIKNSNCFKKFTGKSHYESK